MKKLLLLLLATILASACHAGMMNKVAGSGNRQTQKREIPAFTSIHTEGAFDIDVASQKPLSLEVEADDNILPLVSTTVSNNILYIKNSRSYSTNERIRITIAVPNLEGVSASGAGTIDVDKLKNESFEIDVNGAPTVEVSGETAMLKIKTNGAGKIDTHRLRATQAVVDSNGVSKVALYAKDKLEVTVNGPSNVTYEGDPAVTKTVRGTGTVEKKQSSGSE